jgi:hypothetical protein
VLLLFCYYCVWGYIIKKKENIEEKAYIKNEISTRSKTHKNEIEVITAEYIPITY